MRFRFSGNLYSREVQIDGEQVAIQVQDTPGVQVSTYERWRNTLVFYAACNRYMRS